MLTASSKVRFLVNKLHTVRLSSSLPLNQRSASADPLEAPTMPVQKDVRNDGQQGMFDGFVFALVPSVGSKVAKIKEKTFEKHGAAIAPTLNDLVTHVLVANRMIKILPDKYKAGPWELLRDEWASESIDQKHLVQTRGFDLRPRFVAAGEVASASQEPSSSQNNSPNLKRTMSRTSRPIISPSGFAARPEPAVTEETFEPEIVSPRAKNEENPNQKVIDAFLELYEERKAEGQEFSARNYLKASKALGRATQKVHSGAQALSMFPHEFGKRMAQALEEIVQDKIPEETRNKMRERGRVLALLQTVYGVGAKRAREYYAMGYRTLDDIKKGTKDKNMLVSIEHHEDLIERISRTEVTQHYDQVKQIIRDLDANAESYCMGSYRRLEPDCGDIDIIITKRDTPKSRIKELASDAIEEMFKQGFAVHTFGGGAGSSKWLGATALKGGRWRRMDILVVPPEELGAAMIYYTGNDIFNRQMRLTAKHRGLNLNEKGLFKDDTLLEAADEQEIFRLLSIVWQEPQNRYPENFKVQRN